MIVKNVDGKSDDLGGVERKVLAHDGKMMAVEFTFTKGTQAPLHSHPHEQIGYIVSGSFEVQVDGKKDVLSAGDCYYIPPNIEHCVTALEDGIVFDAFTPQREDFL